MAPPDSKRLASSAATDVSSGSSGAAPLAAPERRRQGRRNAWLTVRHAEPAMLAIIGFSAALLLAGRWIEADATQMLSLLLLAAAFGWSYAETVREGHRFELLARLVRVALVALAAPAFVFVMPHGGWPWLWLLGLTIVHPCALGRRGTVLYVLANLVYEEALSFHLRGGFSVTDSVMRIISFSGMATLSCLWGEALETGAQARKTVFLREQRAQVIAAYSDVVLLFADEYYRLAHINRAAQRILGYPLAELRRRWGIDLMHPDDQEAFRAERLRLLAAPGRSTSMQLRIRHAEGHWKWFEVRITNLLEHPAVRGFFASATDISALMGAEEDLRNERALLRTVIDNLPMSVYTKGHDGRFRISNQANLARLGLQQGDQLIGRRSAEVARNAQAQVIDRDDLRVLEHGEKLIAREYRLMDLDGTTRWFQATKLPLLARDGGITGLLGIVQDVTTSKSAEIFLREQATHDPLTGLYNRRFLTDQLAAILARDKPAPMALMFCDLDLFKAINDRYGHEIGDRFLTALGSRLASFGQMPGRTLARFGGDEFVLLTPCADEGAALELGRALLSAIREPIEVDDLRLDAEASLGIALLRPDHERPEDLIRDADAAMYQAKGQLGRRIAVFDDQLRARTSRHAGLIHALRRASGSNQLHLQYQPKIDLQSGKVAGFEALMRWTTPDFGPITPSEFIPLAEESGQIVRLGRWALEEACHQLRRWQVRYPQLDSLTIAVNVSMRQLLDEHFVDDVVRIIEASQIYPAALELELTESAAMQNPDRVVAVLQGLKQRGLRLALDDFGTGYSSLAHLRRLPVDVLKIDRAFVHGMSDTEGDAEIVRLVIALAKTLGFESVAEGIEQADTASEVRQLGCDLGQGFHFAHPLNASEADDLLASDRRFAVALA